MKNVVALCPKGWHIPTDNEGEEMEPIWVFTPIWPINGIFSYSASV